MGEEGGEGEGESEREEEELEQECNEEEGMEKRQRWKSDGTTT
jgi:hypothetical protein